MERPLLGLGLHSGRQRHPGCTSRLQPRTLCCTLLHKCCFQRGPTPARRGWPALSSTCRDQSTLPLKTNACQLHAKEPRKSGLGSEAVMPTQLWVRAPVPGPWKLGQSAQGPRVEGSLPSAGRGPRLGSQEQRRAGGLLGTEPCPELCLLRAVPLPLHTHIHIHINTHTHTHTHTRTHAED